MAYHQFLLTSSLATVIQKTSFAPARRKRRTHAEAVAPVEEDEEVVMEEAVASAPESIEEVVAAEDENA